MTRSAPLALTVCGVCLLLVGCWEKAKENDAQADALVAQKAKLADLRYDLLSAHHAQCVESFITREGVGYSRMPSPSHDLAKFPTKLSLPLGEEMLARLPAGEPVPNVLLSWDMDRVYLIGIAMSLVPQVYLVGELPMPLLGYKTRDLDDFEREMLPRLQTGEEIVFQDKGDTIRMIGAVRAKTDCLKCHKDKKEGEILGAFTYTLKREAPKILPER